MQKRNSKILFTVLIVGIILLWGPVLFSIVITTIHFLRSGQFLFDFLIPLEIFPVIMVGEFLVLYYTIKKRFLWKPTLFFTISTVTSYVLIDVIASLSGLASNGPEVVNTPYAMIAIAFFIAFYWVSFVWIAMQSTIRFFKSFSKS